MKTTTIKILRGFAVVFMALTVMMTLLGGVGTSCVAWNADKYGKAFAMFVPYMTTYQGFVYVSVLTGLVGGIVAYALVRRERWAFVGSLVTLLVCLVAAAVQMFYTSSLKEVSFFRTPPTNVRFFLSVATLALFLVLRLPGIWDYADFTQPWRGTGTWATPSGLALFVAGVATLTTPVWAGPSHMLDGYNLVYVMERPLLVVGWGMTASGVSLLAFAVLRRVRRSVGVRPLALRSD